MSAPLNSATRLAAVRQAKQFERSLLNPAAVQAQVLANLLAKNAHTVFGIEHGFKDIQSPADYLRQVPIRDYEGHRAYINRAIGGEVNVLTADVITRLALTSGTTDKPKFIPLTESFAAEQADLTRLWLFHALRAHPAAYLGKILMLSSPAIEGCTDSGLPFGAMTGVAYENTPSQIQEGYAVPASVSHIQDFETRLIETLRYATAENVTAIAAPNAATLLRLASLASRLELDLRDCWPNLALIGCWLGGSAGLQAAQLGRFYGEHVPLRDLGLMASEGRMTVPMSDGSAAGALAIETQFFEFLPEEMLDSTPLDVNPPTLLAHELEDGKRYSVITTGSNGLYRYAMHDIVEVQGFHGLTPKVAFIRKGRDMVSIMGEKLHLNQVQAALDKASKALGITVWQYRFIANAAQNCHHLHIEPTADCLETLRLSAEQFVQAFDVALIEQNIEYAAKRLSKRLNAPQLQIMPIGWSEAQCLREFAAGKREAQHKWRVMVNDPTDLD